MSATVRKKRAARKKRFFQEGRRRIKKRLANMPGPERPAPMMTATNIHYEQADRIRGLSAGGIGAILLLAQKIDLTRRSTGLFICSNGICPTTNPTMC